MNFKKNEIRKSFIKIRNNLSISRRKLAEKKATILLSSLGFDNILSFSSKSKEINLWSLNTKLSKEKRLLLPKIHENSLLIFEVNDFNTQLVKGSFDLFEPDVKKCKLIDYKNISCVLVPGIAFDNNNQRLGYGKGYYDRFLSKINCPTIGVGFIEQLSNDNLPLENHDIKLNDLFLF
jgi:5-formyltetrahydrofolate cyclo-ligase